MPAKQSIHRSMTRRGFLAALPIIPMTAGAGVRSSLGKRAYDFRPVRTAITDAVRSGKATGIAVAAVHGGRIIWEEGFGWADRQAGLRATAHTPFSLASLSKPFTTTALMTLAAAGKLSLDASANAYLGGVRLRGPMADAATVRQLGAHASGLPSLFEMYPPGGGGELDTAAITAAPPDREAVLRAYGKLVYPPGRVYEYSNVGYEALGMIATRLSGMEFGAFLTSRVLAPLGLHHSFFDTDRSGLAHAAARYDELDRPIPYYTTATPPSGELYASAHDLAIFAMLNLGESIPLGHSPLPKRWIAEMHRPVLRGSGAGSTTFGWFAGRGKSGLPVLFKDGGQPGVSTIMYVVPSESLACVVLTNRSDNGDLAQSLVDQMMGRVLPEWTTPDTSPSAATSPFAASPDWTGRWSGRLLGGGADMEMALEISPDSRISLSLGDRPPQPVTRIGLEGRALVGRTSGMIQAPDAVRNVANALAFKLLRDGATLRGRMLALASAPGKLATIPFAVSLERGASG